MNTVCSVILVGFAVAYMVALGLLLVGTFGLFGQERDPLSGVFLMPLGLPWNLFFDSASDTLKPWLASLAPALNLALLWLLCRTLRRLVA